MKQEFSVPNIHGLHGLASKLDSWRKALSSWSASNVRGLTNRIASKEKELAHYIDNLKNGGSLVDGTDAKN